MAKRSNRDAKKILNTIFLVLILICLLLVAVHLAQGIIEELRDDGNLLLRGLLVIAGIRFTGSQNRLWHNLRRRRLWPVDTGR